MGIYECKNVDQNIHAIHIKKYNFNIVVISRTDFSGGCINSNRKGRDFHSKQRQITTRHQSLPS